MADTVREFYSHGASVARRNGVCHGNERRAPCAPEGYRTGAMEIQGGRTDSLDGVDQREHRVVWMRRRQTVRSKWRHRNESLGSGDTGRDMGVAGGSAGRGVHRKRGWMRVRVGCADRNTPLEGETRRASIFDGVCSGEKDLCGMRRRECALYGHGDGEDFVEFSDGEWNRFVSGAAGRHAGDWIAGFFCVCTRREQRRGAMEV